MVLTLNSGIHIKYSTVQIKRVIFYLKKKDDSFYAKIRLVYIFVKMWSKSPFSKTGVEMMSINCFVGLIKNELLKEISIRSEDPSL